MIFLLAMEEEACGGNGGGSRGGEKKISFALTEKKIRSLSISNKEIEISILNFESLYNFFFLFDSAEALRQFDKSIEDLNLAVVKEEEEEKGEWI
ncbi:hypothetical protein FRX31_034896 [Thalictrum thalictroides]|uniref:Uncharacterized protein n=1 Tax=Thalictrum thalictroides TaxID=46969 RepID=A0A7J6USK0_THATH|nr:hypothetical protein FRX31_034896 [Thalictrum thalictroides]